MIDIGTSASASSCTPGAQPDELGAWLRLAGTRGMTPGAARALLAAFGLPGQILSTPPGALAQVVPRALASRLLAAPDAALHHAIARTQAWATVPGQAVLTLADAAYPSRLLDLADPPLLLYALGNVCALGRPTVAIVGARDATLQGERDAYGFARTLAGAGWSVVSGLALGIDAAAHAGALDGVAGGPGPGHATIAVVGTGIDRVYPPGNRALAARIAENGLIVSELPLGAPARSLHFPRRNRLIAALCRGVVVIEAALRSGSLITARLATELGREVMAVPGSIHALQSRGCHALIRQGAQLVQSADDVLEELGGPAALPGRPVQRPPLQAAGPSLDAATSAMGGPLVEARQAIFSLLAYDPVDADTLAGRSGLPVAVVTAALLALELDGIVEGLPGSRYRRLA